MPVRVIKQIEKIGGRIGLAIPTSIVDIYGCPYDFDSDRYYDVFSCEFKNHFDKSENLVRKINESSKLQVVGICVGQPQDPFLLLEGNLIAMNYGFVDKDYIEVIFQAIKRNTKVISIFPERLIEDLDFVL